jgi:hypothetical protein
MRRPLTSLSNDLLISRCDEQHICIVWNEQLFMEVCGCDAHFLSTYVYVKSPPNSRTDQQANIFRASLCEWWEKVKFKPVPELAKLSRKSYRKTKHKENAHAGCIVGQREKEKSRKCLRNAQSIPRFPFGGFYPCPLSVGCSL